jgi:virginiamycin A acetyltransferase
MTVPQLVKRSAQGVALVVAFPAALACGFGRLPRLYVALAQAYALGPGPVGNVLRSAFYRLTLRDCSIDTTISLGTYFVDPDATVGPYVSIGSYCVIGRARIGARTQIASHVQITSGRHEHARDDAQRLLGSAPGETIVGADCWIGASAVVMAEVGDGCTIGAGAVVVHKLPPRVLAVGNPARIVRSLGEGAP